MFTETPTISVAVPVYCEQQGILEFHRRLTAVLEDPVNDMSPWEIVYADDGSSDETPIILAKLAADDARVRVINFSRNFGHQAAITAAVEYASGQAIIVIDSDLQDPPEVIPQMAAMWRNGFQVVYGQRTRRAGESAFKKVTASLFYRILGWLSDVEIPRDVGDFRLIDRRVAQLLNEMPERSRYVRGMVAWIGFRQCAIQYDREPRFAGETKYPVRKMLKFAVDATTSFSDKPLKVASRVGFMLIVGAGSLATWLLVGQLALGQTAAPGWSSLMLTVILFGGVQLLTIGVLGEYVARIYREVQHRPIYVVAQDSRSAVLDTGDKFA